MPSQPVSHAGEDSFPRVFVARHHERYHQRAVGPQALDLGNFAQVGFQVAVGDQLYVVEAQQAPVVAQQRAIARAVHVDHGWPGFAQRFPDHAAPARLESAVDVDGFVGGRRRGEPEGIGAGDARESGAEVSHGGYSEISSCLRL